MTAKDKHIGIFSSNNKRDYNFKDYKYRDWDYQKINNYKNTSIEGKLKRKVNLSPKKEKIYNNIKIYPQPNTKRTIFPEYAPITNEKPSGRKKVDTKSYYGNKRNYSQGIKTNANKNKESKEEIPSNKRHIKNSKYQDYKTTQIANLPGAIIRDINDINDDINYVNKLKDKKNRTSYFINKLKNDYCSNVTCLPNSLTNNLGEKQIVRGKSYNIFNYKNKNEYNIFDYGPKSKINRNKNNEKKERPFSSNYHNYHNNIISNVDNIYNNKRYKNAESYQSFDMLKPSSIFEKKYEFRAKNL